MVNPLLFGQSGGFGNLFAQRPLGQARQVVQGIQGLTRDIPAGLTAFPRTFRAQDFFSAAVSISATDFTKVGSVTVSAQQIQAFGQGGPSQPSNQGYIRMSPAETSAGASMTGRFRLDVANATETNIFTILDERSDRLDVSSTDKNLLTPLPLAFPAALQDSLLIIRMLSDTASQSLSPTLSTFNIPVTTFQ